MLLVLAMFLISLSSAEFHVDIYATNVNGSVGSVTVYDLGDYFRVNATNGDYETDRALVMEWLFYGTDGTDPRATPTYMTNPTKTISYDIRDYGKRGHYATTVNINGATALTYTGTFADTSNNYNTSSWSMVNLTASGGGWARWYLPAATLLNEEAGSPGTTDEMGTDTSADQDDNPADCKLAVSSYAAGQTAEVHAVVLSNGAIAWARSGTGTASHIDFLGNYSFPEFEYIPQITLNSIENDTIHLVHQNITFNTTATIGGVKTLANITLYINGTLNETKALSGSSDTEIFTKKFKLGSYNWSVVVCNNESLCTTSETRVFGVENYVINSVGIDAISYETLYETYSINITSYNSSLLTAVTLVLNGTEYTTTQSGDNWSKSMDLPSSIVGNQSVYFKITYDGTSYNTSTYYQYINYTLFGLCNATLSDDFLNLSFMDETTLSSINATIPSSTWIYYLGSGTVTKTYTFVNTTANDNYTFCATPSQTLHVNPYVQYASSGYPQRLWDVGVRDYNSTVTNTILYLLGSANGIYVTFQIINSADQPLENVAANITRSIGGEDVLVGMGTSGASGTLTFWMNPDFAHTAMFYLSPYSLYTITQTFTNTEYTINMGGSTSSGAYDYQSGISYTITPTSWYLENDTYYNFSFALSSSYWALDSYGFNITNEDGTLISQVSDTTNVGGLVDLNISTMSNETFCMNGYWIINSTRTSFTRCWVIIDISGNTFSLSNLFIRLTSYVFLGFFGLDDLGIGIFIFIIIVLTTGTLKARYGISNESVICGVIFALVALFDITFGLIPNPVGSVDNFTTIFVGVVFIGFLIKEALQ